VALRLRFRFLLPALLALIVGCGGGALNSNSNHTGGASTNGNTTSSTTGASGVLVSHTKGGSVHDAAGQALVVIPANALAADTKIYVTPSVTIPAVPEGTQLLTGSAFDLTPEGLFFNTPASLTLNYDPATVPAGMPQSAIRVYTVSNGTWQPIDGTVVNTTYHSISVPLAHFSTYAALCATSLTDGPVYDVIDCGVLSGDAISSGAGISSDGKVVGQSTSAAGAPRAFMWQTGILVDLGRRSSDIGSRAISVSANGLAGGASMVNATSSYPVKFSYGTVTQVNTQFGQTPGAVTALNDTGTYVVGNAIVRSGALTVMSNFSAAQGSGALNANDEVAGSADSKAAFWKSSGVVDAGLLTGYDTAVGTALSDDESLAGVAYNAGEATRVGFIYRSGSMAKIPSLQGDTMLIPTGVNALGQVVGNSIANSSSRGFLYSNGSTLPLNTLIPSNLGWQIVQANAINNKGQIVGTGILNGTQHAIMLTPRAGR